MKEMCFNNQYWKDFFFRFKAFSIHLYPSSKKTKKGIPFPLNYKPQNSSYHDGSCSTKHPG